MNYSWLKKLSFTQIVLVLQEDRNSFAVVGVQKDFVNMLHQQLYYATKVKKETIELIYNIILQIYSVVGAPYAQGYLNTNNGEANEIVFLLIENVCCFF